MIAMDLEGRFNYLLGGRRDLRQRLRADERERDDARDKYRSPIRQVKEAEGTTREARKYRARCHV